MIIVRNSISNHTPPETTSSEGVPKLSLQPAQSRLYVTTWFFARLRATGAYLSSASTPMHKLKPDWLFLISRTMGEVTLITHARVILNMYPVANPREKGILASGRIFFA